MSLSLGLSVGGFPDQAAVANQGRPSWNIELLIDQSGSMQTNDPELNALIAPAILADLSKPRDRVTLGGLCRTTRCPAVALDHGNGVEFKEALQKLAEGTGSKWDGSFEQSLKRLREAPPSLGGSAQRSILLVHDDEKEDRPDESKRKRMVDEARRQRVSVHVMHLHPKRRNVGLGAMGDPVRYTSVTNGGELLTAFSRFFQSILGTSSGAKAERSRPGEILFEVPDGAARAWMIVLADQRIEGLELRGDRPTKVQWADSPKHSGYTFERDGKTRSYAIYRVDRPEPAPGGRGLSAWNLVAKTTADRVHTLLLLEYALTIDPDPVRGQAGQPTPVRVSIGSDFASGKLQVRFRDEQGGGDHELICRPDGDRRALCEADVLFQAPGARDGTLEVKVKETDVLRNVRVPVVVTGGPPPGPTPGSESCPVVSVSQAQSLTVKYWISSEGEHPDRFTASIDGWPHPEGQRIELAKVKREGTKTEYESAAFLVRGVPLGEYIWKITDSQAGTTPCRITVVPYVSAALEPAGQATLGPCEANASSTAETSAAQQGCSDKGECCGARFGRVFTSELLGVEVIEATLQLGAGAELPPGVSLFLGGSDSRAEITDDEPLKLHLRKGEEVPIWLCSDACAPATTAAQVTLDLSVPGVFYPGHEEACETAARGADDPKTARESCMNAPGTLRQTARVDLRVEESHWWPCWRYRIIQGLILLLILAILYGFVRALRFPQQGAGGSRFGFPQAYGSRGRGEIGSLHQGMEGLRVKMPLLRWYSNDVIYLTGSTLDPTRKPAGALVCIRLIRRKGKKPCPWIEGLSGKKLLQARWTEGQGFKAYRFGRDPDVVEEGGEPLRLDTVYLVNGEDRVFKFQ